MCSKISPENLCKIAQNVEEPCVIRGFGVPWKCLGSNLSEFCKIFDGINPQGVVFDKAPHKHGSVPQWEHFREKTPQITLEDFLKWCSSEEADRFSLSFGYKSFRELPEEIRNAIDFSPLGFPDIQEDITMWLGSKGAHTSCHFDTYGRNIVVQVFGHKRWILFSPECNLQATRIPFEESSVYSQLNFFSPNDLNQFRGIEEQAHIVTLAPGDVLIVPPKWWHFVENLDAALALNAWIPIDQDTEAQMQECFVKSIVFQFLRDIEPQIRKFMVYPNEMEDFEMDPSEFLKRYLRVLDYLRSLILKEKEVTTVCNPVDLKDLMANKSIKVVGRSTKESFLGILTENQGRFDQSWRFPELTVQQMEIFHQLTELINSLCDHEAIDKMKRRYLKLQTDL